MGEKSSVVAGLQTAFPLVLGYVPIAFSFGVAATRSGLSGWEAFSLSLIVFAGAAQFLAVVLIASGTPVLLAGLTLAAMNLRHLIYGPTLMQKAASSGAAPGQPRFAWVWSFALTDEVFGAALGALAKGQRFSEAFMLALGGATYAAWLGGTALGAWAGGGALDGYPAISAGLDFMLPALFLALLLSILSRRQVPAILVAAVATAVGTWAGSGTIGLFAGMGAGALTGMLMPQPGVRHAE